MSKGQEIIGKFNASEKSEVDLIKEKAIELVDLIEEYGKTKDERQQQLQMLSKELCGLLKVFYNGR